MSRRKKSRHSYPQSASSKSKFDIFNGNVNNPGEFVFIYSIIGLMCLAVLIYFIVSSAPKDPEDLQYATVQFTRYEICDEHLHLYADGREEYYSVPAYQETLTEPEAFLRLCDHHAVLYVGYSYYPKAPEPYFGLEYIETENGTVYLTMEAVHEYRWGDAPAFYAICGGITFLWLLIVFGSVFVGRHPERFSRRTIGLFFKDGVVRRK